MAHKRLIRLTQINNDLKVMKRSCDNFISRAILRHVICGLMYVVDFLIYSMFLLSYTCLNYYVRV